LCLFYLPWLANVTAEMYPEFAYMQYLVLTGLYVSVIPFFIALYQALQLLNCIDDNNAFSALAVKRLKMIKYCAAIISILYAAGAILLITQNAFHLGIAMIGFTIILLRSLFRFSPLFSRHYLNML